MSIEDFCDLIGWNREKNNHHVFSAKLIKGARKKAQLGPEELEENFSINLKETKAVLVPAHWFYNKLFRNSSPPVILEKLSELISGDYILYRAQKKIFVKFCLCVVREKIQNNSSEIKGIIKSIDIDINDGNSLRPEDIINVLGLTENDLLSYLEEKFFPNNWRELAPNLWSLYL